MSTGRELAKRLTIVTIAAMAAGTLEARACGFERPVDQQRGFLNWIYPDSFHISTAIWQGQQKGMLGRDPALQSSSKLLVNPAYRKTMATLTIFAQRFEVGREGSNGKSFVVLLLEPMLWTRIEPGKGALSLTVHINQPTEGEPVLITERVVLEALNRGVVSFEQANQEGYLRIYGDEVGIAEVRRSFARISPKPANES
ncbi:MAG: hypothetical protein V2I51_15305 [Anderseniella sp.]|jgi:hypothetical protein|nr:hypothetical protein [Anderseniella sp.]